MDQGNESQRRAVKCTGQQKGICKSCGNKVCICKLPRDVDPPITFQHGDFGGPLIPLKGFLEGETAS